MNNILVTGGTGFIGSALVSALMVDHKVTVLAHKNIKVPSGCKVIKDLTVIDSTTNIDAIINLAGCTIAKRWSSKYKEALLTSRITTTEQVLSLISRLQIKPQILLNASAIGFYGSHGEEALVETATATPGFTHDLCKKWEQLALKAQDMAVKVAILRLGVVLGKNGGALTKMLPAFKLGLGGKLGNGQQYFSWVHLTDVIRAIIFLLQQQQAGVFNITAPNPVTNSEFTRELALKLHRPAFFHMPAGIVKLLFGEMGQILLLEGQRVIPAALNECGFNFQYPTISAALAQIINSN